MKIYIDFDDCLCETARTFTKIASEQFGKRVPYEEIRFFDLRESFKFTDEEYDKFMTEGHRPENLLSIEETPGASAVINEWIDKGHEVCIITGRPFSTADASRKWLDDHNLKRVKLFFLDKYGRDEFYKKGESNLSLEEFYKMDFDYAIEDSPHAFKFFDKFSKLKVMVFSRPWNTECELPGKNYTRCTDWKMIKKLLDSTAKGGHFF